MSYTIGGVGASAQMATSNNTEQTITTFTVNQNASGYFTANVICRKVSDGATKNFTIRGGFKRNTGNASVNTELLNVLGTSGDLLDLLLATVSVDTSSEDVRIRVKGLSGTNIEWHASFVGEELYEV